MVPRPSCAQSPLRLGLLGPSGGRFRGFAGRPAAVRWPCDTMRLAYLTTHFPFSSDFSHNEAFLEPEVRSLAKYVDALYVIATRPKQRSSVFRTSAARISIW